MSAPYCYALALIGQRKGCGGALFGGVDAPGRNRGARGARRPRSQFDQAFVDRSRPPRACKSNWLPNAGVHCECRSRLRLPAIQRHTASIGIAPIWLPSSSAARSSKPAGLMSQPNPGAAGQAPDAPATAVVLYKAPPAWSLPSFSVGCLQVEVRCAGAPSRQLSLPTDLVPDRGCRQIERAAAARRQGALAAAACSAPLLLRSVPFSAGVPAPSQGGLCRSGVCGSGC